MKIMSVIVLSSAIACGSIVAASCADGGYKPGALAESVKPFVENHTIAGAVMMVSSKDRVLAAETIGYADVEAKKLMQADDLFWIASMTKSMTATCLMMLVDEGKVKLDDPMEKYLPEYKGQMVTVERDDEHAVLKKPAHPVTIREALSHTSGIIGNFPGYMLDQLPLSARVVGIGMSPLRFEPRSKFEYGNGGFESAGRIIELVSGVPYGKFVQDRLLKPLGMTDTTFWPTEKQLQRLAKTYIAKDGAWVEVATPFTYPLSDRSRTPNPAGGLFSTAADVSKYCRMILNGGVHNGKSLLSDASVRTMTTTQTGDLLNNGVGEFGFGLGWVTTSKDHGTALSTTPFGHSGAYRTDMWIDPQKQLIMIIMVQRGQMDDSSIFTNPFRKAAEKAFGCR